MNPNLQQSLMAAVGYPGLNGTKGVGPVANLNQYTQMLNASKQPAVSDSNAQIAALTNQLKQLQQQALATPKIYSYNTADASARARAAAENAVNPYYTQKLNDFLAQEQVKQQRVQQDSELNRQQIDQALQDALQASGVNRQRTTEDAATKLGDVQAASDYYQNTEGNTFDKARSALLSNLAQSGLTTSGLGQQQSNEQVANRNVESANQTRSFNAQTNAINTLKTRTFEDLARSDTQANRSATQGKAKVQVDLDRALQDIGTETKAFKSENEYNRLQSVLGEEGRQYQLGLNDFLQALSKSGARAQDIVATRQLYGA